MNIKIATENNIESYVNFLKDKITIAPESGIEVNDGDIPTDFYDGTHLKPHQRDAIKWALKGGKRALFESFGLGKTIQQLIICKILTEKCGGKALIVCPLGVKQEFTQDAKNKLGITVKYITHLSDTEKDDADMIYITNYERVRDGDINPKAFTVTSLDEASVLRSYGSKTYQEFLQKFKGVPYKYVATATPSPNKYKELIHYGGYLEIMDTGQALTRFFRRDSTQANNLTLHPHKQEEFWLWLSTWALFITKPSDLGYDNAGYAMPPYKIIYHKIDVDHSTAGVGDDGQVKMFRDASMGLKDASKEKRDSIDDRLEKVKEIISQSPDDHFIIWHHLEAERHSIKKAIPEVYDIYGTQDIEEREKRTIDFSTGKIKYIASKPEVSGQGCNFQRHCHKAVFMGINYSFNDIIQAIHRIYRFLQDKEVEIHIIYTESEQPILDTLLKKWRQHDELVANMTAIIKEYGLSNTNIQEKLARTMGIKRDIAKGKRYTCILNDNTVEMMGHEWGKTSVEKLSNTEIKPDSIGLIVTSIPFSNHYEYTPTYNDFGHNADNDNFFRQMDYLTPELLKALQPGRLACIHVKDRILFGNATGTGMPTVDPFSDMTVFHFIKHGFQYMGRITITTDVVRENNQTYRLGWTEQCKDGSKMGIGCPEYVLLFRKLPTDTSKAYADIPVVKTKQEYGRYQWQIDAHGFWRSSGNRFLTHEELKDIPVDDLQAVYREYSRANIYSYENHIDLARNLEEKGKLPASFMVVAPGSWDDDFIWDDVNRMLTFNSEQAAKEKNMHICPLQFDIVDRLITRYSNKDDIVFDPFAGLFTVPARSIKLGRKGIGIELNYESYSDGVSYCRAYELEYAAPTLFDFEPELSAVGK